jgi:hypothetical protein
MQLASSDKGTGASASGLLLDVVTLVSTKGGCLVQVPAGGMTLVEVLFRVGLAGAGECVTN